MRPSKPEKTMSSRLLTMKFMQRAAAAGVHTPSTPTSTRPSDEDSSASIPPAKRRRSDQNVPTSAPSDLDAISAAVKAEEDKRQAAIARQAADAGETNWVLEFPGAGTRIAEERDEGPVVVSMVSDDVDGTWGQGQEEEEEFDGRRGYGGYKRKKTTEPRVSLGTSSQNIDEDALPTSISGGQPSRAHDHRRGDDQSDLNNMVRDHKYKSERDEARRRKLAAQGYKNRGGGGGKLKGGISSGGGISKPSRGQQGSKGKKRR